MALRNNVRYQPRIGQATSATMKKKTYVTKVTGFVLLQHIDQLKEKMLVSAEIYFATCDQRGHIDWSKTSIYTAEELVGVSNVSLISEIAENIDNRESK